MENHLYHALAYLRNGSYTKDSQGPVKYASYAYYHTMDYKINLLLKVYCIDWAGSCACTLILNPLHNDGFFHPVSVV